MSESEKKLLEDIENHLDITFTDDATDQKIWDIIQMGMKWINDKAGSVQDYEKNLDARGLLFEYVRYDMNGVRHMFEKNFGREIIEFVLDKEVADFASSTSL